MRSSTLFAIVALLILPLHLAAQPPQSPNVIVILVDDLGWADLGCYGSDLHETPNLDRLATEGVRFTDAYSASPVCSPTRASILTGRHPARLHMTIWREAALNRGTRKLLEPVCLDSLPSTETTFAEQLKAAGYHNVHLGKWHVGRAEGYPQVHGFHRNIGGTLWGAPQTFWYPYNGDSYFNDWRYVPDLEPGRNGDYLTDALTDNAIAILKQQTEAKRPFFINLWYHTVHTPIEGKPEHVEHYQNKIHGKNIHRNPHYAAMVHSLDENVGRLLATIDELGIRESTYVLFSSDNGGFINKDRLHPRLPVTNNSPLRSGKGSCYEGGIRVPLIVRGPGVTVGGECSDPVYSCDFCPTLLQLAGQAPLDVMLDGISLLPLLQNPKATLDRRQLFFHYPHYYSTTSPVSAVRAGQWKLLEYYEDDRVELYNLHNDAGETINLAYQQPEVRDELRSALHAWRRAVGALEPEANPDR